MARVEQIKLHPSELYSSMAICMAYCIGATHDNVEQIANTITNDEIEECIDTIRTMFDQADFIADLTLPQCMEEV